MITKIIDVDRLPDKAFQIRSDFVLVKNCSLKMKKNQTWTQRCFSRCDPKTFENVRFILLQQLLALVSQLFFLTFEN